MAPTHLRFLVLLSILSLSRSQNPNPNASSAYDELKNRGFPVGLLPANVRSYTLNRTSGDFAVDLDGRCQITLRPDGSLAAHSPKITGKLLGRRISDIDAISFWAFFSWWSITSVRSAGDDVVFDVGFASAKYPAQNFEESPECKRRIKAAS